VRRFRVAVLAVSAVAAVVLSACSSQTSQQPEQTPAAAPTTPVAQSADTAWPVTIDTEDLQPVDFDPGSTAGSERVLALAVGSAEIVDLLGAGGQLVGKDETSVDVQGVPIVTQGHQIEVEQALALEPTVVLVDELVGPPEALDALADAGAQIVNVPSVWTLADVPQRVEAIAGATGADRDSALELSDALVPSEQSAPGEGARVAFLYLRGPSAIYLLGGANTGADALITSAGGVDVGAELGYDGFVPLTAEALVEADPDVLLVMSDGLDSVGGIEGLLELPGVAQTRAGLGERIVEVDDRVLLSFGTRTPALVDRLSEVLGEAGQ